MKASSLRLVLLLVTVFLFGVAGVAAQTRNEKTPEQMLAEIRDDALASRFYETMNGKELDLALVRFGWHASYAPAGVGQGSTELVRVGPPGQHITFVFARNNIKTIVTIIEYKFAEDAQRHFGNPTNATLQPYTGHGEQGVKSYYSGFLGLSFRKDRFFVSISCKDEKLAERLAGYADQTISHLIN